ncbi:hypothetical protein GQ53DRAFT_374254 [Thozetella sp. PMI_491]|nr:hypothetical protein GQ53DRAFT_374254 [Thozetella sp. PMI_491]
MEGRRRGMGKETRQGREPVLGAGLGQDPDFLVREKALHLGQDQITRITSPMGAGEGKQEAPRLEEATAGFPCLNSSPGFLCFAFLSTKSSAGWRN